MPSSEFGSMCNIAVPWAWSYSVTAVTVYRLPSMKKGHGRRGCLLNNPSPVTLFTFTLVYPFFPVIPLVASYVTILTGKFPVYASIYIPPAKFFLLPKLLLKLVAFCM